MILCINAIFAVLFVADVQGFLQSTVSLNIKDNINIKKTGWHKVTTWQDPTETGHVIVGTTVTNGNVYIPYSGVYLAFITITLNGADSGGRFRIRFVINDKLNNSHSTMMSSLLGAPLGPKSISVKGAVLLQTNDFAAVYIYSESDSEWSVTGQSQTTFSLQYINALGGVPGFSAVIQTETAYNSSSWVLLREWQHEGQPGLFKSMTGFSKHTGEFVALCSGIYMITANIQFKTNATGYFDVGIAINSMVNGSTVRSMSSTEFTLSLATSVMLNKGDVIALHISSHGKPFVLGIESSFSAVRLRSHSTVSLGFSTVTENDITGNQGGWVQIPLQLPNGTSFGQFKDSSANSIADGRFYTIKDGMFIISTSIHVVAESLISATLLTRALSPTSISSSITGVYSGSTKSNYQTEVTFSSAGAVQLSKSSPLSFYFYMQNAGNYRILAGSRISVVLTEIKYPAFHATLDADVGQSSDSAWVEVTGWKTDKAIGATSLTDSLSANTGRYTADISGIYLISSNIIFSATVSVISMLVSVNGGQSKRTALFSTKGNPANKDTLNINGALRLTKGEYVSVWVKVTGSPSWSVGDKSSFSVTLLGLPFSVPGFSAVFSSTRTFTVDGWNQLIGLSGISSTGPLFYYGNGLDVANCRYQAPVSGIYIVSANLKLKQATKLNAEFILNVAIDNSPGASTYLNGINDYVLRSVSLGNEDFYSMNVAGAVNLKPNQNVTLWIKSTSAGPWQLSEDSSFSIVLIHQENDLHASGFQAALNPFLAQAVSGATNWKIIRNWESARASSGAGLFSIAKYQSIDSSSGTVTVKESGLYFISALITLKDAAGKFEVGVHIESQLSGLFSTVDSSRLNSHTIRIFGLLYIPENSMVNIMVRAPTKMNWEQDARHSGLSFVKLSPLVIPPTFSSTVYVDNQVQIFGRNWTKLNSWHFSESPSQYFIGDGFSKEAGVFTTKNDGIYIVSGFLEVDIPNKVAAVEMKIALNVDTRSASVVDAGNGVNTLAPQCNESCLLHASAVLFLKGQETVSVFVKSNDLSRLTIKRSSMFSLLLVSQSLPLPNGLHGMLSTSMAVAVKGNKQVTGWQITPSTGGFFGSTGSMSSFSINTPGIFFMSVVIKFRNLLGLAQAFTSIVNIPAIKVMVQSKSDLTFVLSVSGCMKMTADSFYTVTVYSETDTSYEILAGSSKSAVYLGSNPDGFMATQGTSSTLQLAANSVNYILGWSTTGKDWLFESGPGFADKSSYVVQRTGVYYITSHIIISGTFNSSGVHFTLAIEKDGFIRPEEGLFATKIIRGTTTDTLIIAGNVRLEKWTRLKLVILASQAVTINMNIDSTFSIVKLSKELDVDECSDAGPRMIGKLTPEVLRTSYKKPVSWQCNALGTSVTYSWMKDYKVISGATSSTFQIASTQVTDTGEYVCVATANGIRSTSNIAKLTIYDPMPEFVNPVADFNLSVPENGPNVLGILLIQARARSFTNNYARMSFAIISGNINNTFGFSQAQSDFGVTLVRKRQLDRESRDNYTIVISATNLEAYAVATQEINITVTDLNDNVPKFTQAVYQVSIYENTTIGTTVARVRATDLDIGMNAIIKYWFIPSSGGNAFAIDESSGYVTLQGPIDRETRELYVIFVKAYDRSFSSFCELRITILDLNEHAPVFNPLHYVKRVSETLLPGSTILTVTASDNDTGVNAELTYEITGGDPERVFRITKYGVIQNQKTLNYEKNTSYSLTVSVRDNGRPNLLANKTANVMIYVSDANDNSPHFSQPKYVVNLLENVTQGIMILDVDATDHDAAGQPESTLTYALEGSASDLEKFFINSTTGSITLNTTLDYELVKAYILTVTASDAGVPSLKDKAQIIINVVDVNDNRPQFSQSYVIINVTESSQVNRDIYKVTAHDKDSGLNSELRYSLQSGNTDNTFTIDPVSGIVIAMSSLDHERTLYYELKISCNDLGSPQMTSLSYFTMFINVQDENDNAPSFDSEKYSAEVPENTMPGSSILKINVSDSDSGRNGNFSLLIKGSAQNVFKFDPSGALVLISKLDYEIQSHYQFSVVAKDYGIPSLEKSASIEIHVTDVNDNIPSFSQPQYDTQLPEMVYANVTVFQMIAKDPDIGPGRRLSYEIVGGNPKGEFKIGKYDGIVETVTFLNTTFVTAFNLEIVAKDSFIPPAVSNRTLLNIHVTKTPNVRLADIKAGTTSLEATLDVSEFSYLKIVRYEVLVQQYLPRDPNFNMAGALIPITWFEANIKPSPLNMKRRYVAMTVNATSTKRKRRNINSNNLIRNVVIGNEIGCEKKTGSNEICNGPLQSNKQYRLQVRGYVLNSKFPRDSHFSVPIQLGEPAASSSKLGDPSTRDGTIGLSAAFGASTILTIILFIAYVQYKRRHQIIDIEHVNKNLIQDGVSYMEPLTQRTRFDSISDIGMWPKISLAAENKILQQSHNAKEALLHIPRSPGDSGINQANDDDDSWKLSDDEGWENQSSRSTRMTQSMPSNSLHRQARRLRGVSDSNTSLDTNAEHYRSSLFSENLRHILNNDVKQDDKFTSSVVDERKRKDNNNEVETEFGPDLETSFGADADLSSIDEEFEDE